MSVAPEQVEELCPSCGRWVYEHDFDYDTGWCHDCSGTGGALRCSSCGSVLPEGHGRTMCQLCRQEHWFIKHEDELEFLVVAKGYTLWQARLLITKMIRPICHACGKPINGGNERALFHQGRDYKRCRQAYGRYRSMQRQGLTTHQALAKIRETYQGR